MLQSVEVVVVLRYYDGRGIIFVKLLRLPRLFSALDDVSMACYRIVASIVRLHFQDRSGRFIVSFICHDFLRHTATARVNAVARVHVHADRVPDVRLCVKDLSEWE